MIWAFICVNAIVPAQIGFAIERLIESVHYRLVEIVWISVYLPASLPRAVEPSGTSRSHDDFDKLCVCVGCNM